MSKLSRVIFVVALICCRVSAVHAQATQPVVNDTLPREWIDKDTGHRVIRLSDEDGSQSLYFNENAYTPDGKKLIIQSPTGLYTIELATRKIEQIVAGPIRVIMSGFKNPTVYYRKGVFGTDENLVYAVDLNTKESRLVATLPPGGTIYAVNADETLLGGVLTEVNAKSAATTRLDPARLQPGAPNRGQNIDERFNEHLDMDLLTVNIATGAVRTFAHSTEWLNHVQFSPTDPNFMLFCHEGPWHKVDRIWTVDVTSNDAPTLVHQRSMEMEIAGHEFFNGDGSMVWYDLQTPRGEDFWVGGRNVKTGERIQYHLLRDEWSVHFNVSKDGTLFAGDGGEPTAVARAQNGKWIYLFRPRLLRNEGAPEIASKDLIKTGVFESERLVNMKNHNYALEPNVTFSPDKKWIVFRSNMLGPIHVYAVEIAKAE
jgi:oligogalacturonide lyase